MLVLSRSAVEELLDLDALVDAVALAMADLSAGRSSVPGRVAAMAPDGRGLLAAMPGYVPSADLLMAKAVTLFPGNAGTALPTHQAAIVVFDPNTGRPDAVLDGTAITEARTAAGSALSARLLAREDTEVLAIVGTGRQARSHARAMCRVRPIRRIRIAGRDLRKSAALAADLAGTLPADVTAAPSAREAVEGADLVCVTTDAPEPVIRRSWLPPGAHVTSVGMSRDGRELDSATVADALLCVESRGTALEPFPVGSNDLLVPLREGAITAGHIHAEIGELVTGERTGRASPEQLTLYKSTGCAEQDAAATALVLAAARRRGFGEEIPF
ncbi:ornithine cyclodeaminase family protein [Streptomyces sp. NPDC055078]